MEHTDFALLVSEDVKNKLDQKSKDFLRLEENREEWRKCIMTIISTVTEKINQLSAEVSALRSEYAGFIIDPAEALEAKLDKAKRFRFHAEKRLVEIDRLTMLGQESDPSLSLATFLRDAIEAHRQWHIDNDLVPSEGDDSLYAALDGVWGF